jgi:hypothetical protein
MRIKSCGCPSIPVICEMVWQLIAIVVMWVNVQVAMPAMMHSSNTAESASPPAASGTRRLEDR